MAKKLEDWLSEVTKPRERSNYVGEEYVPEPIKADPVKAKAYEQMVEEDKRQNLNSKDGMLTVSAAEVEKPVVAEKPSVKETIKSAMAPQAPAPQQQQFVDRPYARESASVSAKVPVVPQAQDSSVWERALVGATPLLVGLLTGNSMEGVQVAGNHLVKDEGDLTKRHRDLNGKLAELAMKRELAGEGGKRRFTAQTIALNDGTNVKATFDTFTGKYLTPDGAEIPSNFIRSGYAVNPEEFDRRTGLRSEVKRADADYLSQNTKTDPTTGELGVVRNGVITPVQGQSTGKFNKKQEADINAAVKEFTSSDPYKDATAALSLAPQVSSLLDAVERDNDPNSIAGNSVVLTMIRQAQRVGVASDRDAAAMGGTQQWEESINRITEKLLGSGKPLTQRDIQDLREISNIYTKRAQTLLSEYSTGAKKAFSQRYNIPLEDISSQIDYNVKPYTGPSEKSITAKNAPKVINYKGTKYEAPSREHKVLVEKDGKVFWSTNTWEEIKDAYPSAKRID